MIGIRPAELPVLIEAMARHPRLRAAALDIETRSIVNGQWHTPPVADADARALQAAWSCCQQLTTLRVSWFPQAYLAVLLEQKNGLRRLGICGQIDVANRRRLLALNSERLIELDLSRTDVALDFVHQLNLPALQKIGVLVGSGTEVARDWNGTDVGTYVGLLSPADIESRYLADRPWAVGCWISDGWLFPGRLHDD